MLQPTFELMHEAMLEPTELLDLNQKTQCDDEGLTE